MNNNGTWSELFHAKASIYALDEVTKQWLDRGTSGAFVMFLNNQFQSDVRIKWEKHGKQFWWRLINGKLKPKGERAWVLKAWATHNNTQEILAIRFSDQSMSNLFYQKYHSVFPQQQQAAAGGGMALQNKTNPKVKGQKWECAVCTYRNGAVRATCEMCGLPKESSDSNDQQNGGIIDPKMMGKIPETPSMVYNMVNGQQVQQQFFNGQQQQNANLQAQQQYLQQQQQQQQQRLIGNFNMQRQWGQPNMQQWVNMQQQQQPLNMMNVQNLAQQQSWNSASASAASGANSNSNEHGGGWQCKICNVLNRIQSARCEACNTPRNNMMFGNNANLGRFGQWMAAPVQGQYPNNNASGAAGGMGRGGGAAANAGGAAGGAMFGQQAAQGGQQPRQNLFAGNQWGTINMSSDPKDVQKMAQMVSKEMKRLGSNRSATVSTEQEFQHAASYIASYNDDPYSIFKTLKSVSSKLQKDEMRYRTLDTTNPKVMERLIGFEGVLEFLMLLGFESDAIGMKLVCADKPSQNTIDNGTNVLNSYVLRLGLGRITKKGADTDGMGGMMSMGGDDTKTDGDNINGGGGSSDLGSFKTLGGPDDEPDDGTDSLTIEQIIVWGTHDTVRDYGSMETLLLTHKTFTDSLTLIKQLRKRFFVPVPLNIRTDPQKAQKFRATVQKSIQLKVLKSLRDWMKHYWEEDFAQDEDVQNELRAWLQEMNQKAIETSYMDHFATTVKKEFARYLQSGPPIRKLPMRDLKNKEVTGKQRRIQSFTETDLADQITLMDFHRFSIIDARECLGQAWKKKDNATMAPNILGMIQQFNDLTLFVQIQILREKNLKFRAKAIRRVIRMGQRFEELHNYNSLCAIYSSLNSAPIHRLKHAWAIVKKEQLAVYENFSEVFDRSFNHRNLRTILRNVSPPAVPHIGLFLQDLVFIDDGNSKMISINNFENLGGGTRHNNMVNFNKCVRCADRIKSIKLYQEHAYDNILKENENLQILLVQEFAKLQEITEDEIWDMSSEIKAADERESKKGLFNAK